MCDEIATDQYSDDQYGYSGDMDTYDDFTDAIAPGSYARNWQKNKPMNYYIYEQELNIKYLTI